MCMSTHIIHMHTHMCMNTHAHKETCTRTLTHTHSTYKKEPCSICLTESGFLHLTSLLGIRLCCLEREIIWLLPFLFVTLLFLFLSFWDLSTFWIRVGKVGALVSFLIIEELSSFPLVLFSGYMNCTMAGDSPYSAFVVLSVFLLFLVHPKFLPGRETELFKGLLCVSSTGHGILLLGLFVLCFCVFWHTCAFLVAILWRTQSLCLQAFIDSSVSRHDCSG